MAVVGRGVYFSIIPVVGAKDVVIFLRLWIRSVGEYGGRWGGPNLLGRAAGISEAFSEVVEGEVHFFF